MLSCYAAIKLAKLFRGTKYLGQFVFGFLAKYELKAIKQVIKWQLNIISMH